MSRASALPPAEPRDDGRTRRGLRTREHILERAAALIRSHGLRATSVSDILAAASVPKGCFYHHFESKDALGLEILGRWSRELEGRLLDYLTRADGPPPLERIAAALDGFVTEQEQSGCRGGSAFGSLATELSDEHETFRIPLAAAFTRLTQAFAQQLELARAQGDLASEAEPAALAESLVATLEGGILLARVHRDVGVLTRVLRAAEVQLFSLRR